MLLLLEVTKRSNKSSRLGVYDKLKDEVIEVVRSLFFLILGNYIVSLILKF